MEQLEEKELPSGGAKIVFTESSSDVLRKIYHRCSPRLSGVWRVDCGMIFMYFRYYLQARSAPTGLSVLSGSSSDLASTPLPGSRDLMSCSRT